MKTLWIKTRAGIKFGFYFLLISFLMGILYGVFAGIPLQTGKVAAILVGVFVTINFIFSLLAMLPMIAGLILGKKGFLLRYFGLSSGFMIVFIIYFLLLKLV
jgi:hypothetical protein